MSAVSEHESVPLCQIVTLAALGKTALRLRDTKQAVRRVAATQLMNVFRYGPLAAVNIVSNYHNPAKFRQCFLIFWSAKYQQAILHIFLSAVVAPLIAELGLALCYTASATKRN